MKQGHKAVVWFNEVTKNDIPLVGGKGANLGEMTNAGIPVPPGFIVTSSAYFDFIEKAKLQDKIKSLLAPLDVRDSKQLQETATKVQKLIVDAPMPPKAAKEIEQAYVKMGKGLVAVRSSSTVEDLPEASFAGQQATFLNVQGEKEVVEAVHGCWASLFGARAIFYRQEQGLDHFRVGIAVPVQRMVQSESSGVMFAVEPTSINQEKIAISESKDVAEKKRMKLTEVSVLSHKEDGYRFSNILRILLPKEKRVRIFLCHSSKDHHQVSSIVKWIMAVSDIDADRIRCTSVPGCKLDAGAHSSIALLDDIKKSRVFIALITKKSLNSVYVLTEIGARWGNKKPIILLLSPEVNYSDIKPPLCEYRAIRLTNQYDILQLVDQICKQAGVRRRAMPIIVSEIASLQRRFISRN